MDPYVVPLALGGLLLITVLMAVKIVPQSQKYVWNASGACTGS